MDASAASPPPVGETEPVPAAPSGRLWNRNFTLLWVGQTVSHLGNPAFNIGAMLWMMKTTGSASLMGLLATTSMLPGILLAPFGGAFADRYSRIRIVIISDLVAGLAVLAFALTIWWRPTDTALVIPLLFVVSLILGIVRAFFGPAVSAAIPDLVPQDKLAAANSMNQLSMQGSIISGQALGGALYTALGAAGLFLIDAVSYLFATACTAVVPRDTPPPAPPGDVHPFQQLLRDTGEGVRYVWSNTGMRDFVLMASIVNFLAAPAIVLFPFFVDLYMKVDEKWFGFLVAGISVGSVLGFVLAGMLRIEGTKRAWALLTAMVLYPLFAGMLVFLRSPIPVLLAVGASGIMAGFINVFFITSLQRSTPAEMRGRVMGFLATLGGGLMPLGMALGGIAGDLTGKNVPLVFGVCSGLTLLVTLLLGFRRPCREYLAGS